MRILLDQNLSPKLIRKLEDIFPGLHGVYHHNLIGVADPLGSPTKVIRIKRCEFPSSVIEQLIRREAIRIYEFLQADRAVLIL